MLKLISYPHIRQGEVIYPKCYLNYAGDAIHLSATISDPISKLWLLSGGSEGELNFQVFCRHLYFRSRIVEPVNDLRLLVQIPISNCGYYQVTPRENSIPKCFAGTCTFDLGL